MAPEPFDGALCAKPGADPEMWTGEEEKNLTRYQGDRSLKRQAINICHECPVIQACGSYALRHPELSGIWGGMDEKRRTEIRRSIGALV